MAKVVNDADLPLAEAINHRGGSNGVTVLHLAASNSDHGVCEVRPPLVIVCGSISIVVR